MGNIKPFFMSLEASVMFVILGMVAIVVIGVVVAAKLRSSGTGSIQMSDNTPQQQSKERNRDNINR